MHATQDNLLCLVSPSVFSLGQQAGKMRHSFGVAMPAHKTQFIVSLSLLLIHIVVVSSLSIEMPDLIVKTESLISAVDHFRDFGSTCNVYTDASNVNEFNSAYITGGERRYEILPGRKCKTSLPKVCSLSQPNCL